MTSSIAFNLRAEEDKIYSKLCTHNIKYIYPSYIVLDKNNPNIGKKCYICGKEFNIGDEIGLIFIKKQNQKVCNNCIMDIIITKNLEKECNKLEKASNTKIGDILIF